MHKFRGKFEKRRVVPAVHCYGNMANANHIRRICGGRIGIWVAVIKGNSAVSMVQVVGMQGLIDGSVSCIYGAHISTRTHLYLYLQVIAE